MSYIIGMDLGTHQTKICVQNASNPAEKTYEFFKFTLSNGESTYLLPSIVQINKDHTLTYGYVDIDNCLYLDTTIGPAPKLELLAEPKFPTIPPLPEPKKLPPKPFNKKWQKNPQSHSNAIREAMDNWKLECSEIEWDAIRKWNNQCDIIKKSYQKKVDKIREQNAYRKSLYEAEMEEWKNTKVPCPLIFRYFKLHAFTNKGEWNYPVFKSTEITIWYIAYILMLLRERYGDDVTTIQFGVPCGASQTRFDKVVTSKGYEMYIAAAELIKNFNNLEEYLAATYEELQNLTHHEYVSDDVINQNIFDDIPEAFAGLVAITKQRKLDIGFHLLVDIGGGTTDMSLFCVSGDIPDVLYVTSITKGINSILEEAKQSVGGDMFRLQKDFAKNRSSQHFRVPIRKYKEELYNEVTQIVQIIENNFLKTYSHHGKSLRALQKALENQPVIFGGGGGTYSEFYTRLGNFSDVKKIDKSMLSIRNLRNDDIDDNLFTILATSYGLASYEKPYIGGIQCTHISIAFIRFLPAKEAQRRTNYDYEHGMTDT